MGELRRKRFLGCLTGVYAAALVLTGGGCATRQARRTPEYVWDPRAYPATQYAAGGGVVGQAMDAVGFEYSSGWLIPDNLIQGMLLSAVFYGYSLVVEVPISVVTDTAALPYDLRRAAAFREAERFYRVALLGDGWPETAETLRARHVPIASDRVVREFVARPDTPESPAKLRALAEAGLGLELVVGSPHVDADLALRILDRAEPAGTDWPRWTVDPDLAQATRLRAGQHAGRTYDGTPDYRRMSFARFLRGQLIRNPDLPADALLRVLAASEPEAMDPLLRLLAETAYPPDTFQALRLQGDPGVRMAVAANPHVPPAQLAALAGHAADDPRLRLRVARHPQTDADVLDRLSRSDDPEVRRALASNPSLSAGLLARLAEDADDDPALGAQVAAHPHARLETLARLVEFEDPTVGLAVVNRYHIPADLLDRLADLAGADSEAGRRLGLEIARHRDTRPETLDRLARIDDAGIRGAVATHANAPADTLDYLSGLAETDDLRGSLVAAHPRTPEATLRRLGELGSLDVSEQLARNPGTPPETLRLLAREALDILSRPVDGDTYRATVIAAGVVTNPGLPAEDAEAITEAIFGLPIPGQRLGVLGFIVDNPAAPSAALETMLRHLAGPGRERPSNRRDRDRAEDIRRKAENRLALRASRRD